MSESARGEDPIARYKKRWKKSSLSYLKMKGMADSTSVHSSEEEKYNRDLNNKPEDVRVNGKKE